MANEMIHAIDCHAHVIDHTRPITSHRHTQPLRSHTAEELLSLFDENGVSQGLLTAPSFYLTDNSLLLDTLAAHTRFRGTANFPPDIGVNELESFQRAGICGARLNWFKKPELPDISSYSNMFSRLREVGLHLELYVEGKLLPQLLPSILSSGVNLVLDHFGSPDPVDGVDSDGFKMMLDAMNAEQAWVKLSAPYRLQGENFESLAREYAQALLQNSGPERLVWASDWPWTQNEGGMSYQRCLNWLSDWIPDDAHRMKILCDTPRALFGFL